MAFQKGQKGYWLGKKRSEETRKKISEGKKGKKRKDIIWNKGKKGVQKHSEESKQKMRISAFEYAKKICDIICPRVGHNEKNILDKLEQKLGYKIIRQYEIYGYFLDGYIPELKLAIEVDEIPKNRERDIERQRIIEKELNCKFIRIKDYD